MSKRGDAARELERSRQHLRDLGSKATQADKDRVTAADKAYRDETTRERFFGRKDGR